MIEQREITLREYTRGFHIVTSEIEENLGDLPQTGLLNLFILHTSAGLSINENYDPDVRKDLDTIFDRLVPLREDFAHSDEGPDDMPAHAKSILTGTSLSIPITNGKLNLGTWQGIYLCEFRDRGGKRTLVATIIS